MVRINVAAHQKKEKMGKGEAGKERKQSNEFREAACCPSAVVQGQNSKKIISVRGVPRITGTL